MTAPALIQTAIYATLLVVALRPVAGYVLRTFAGEPTLLGRLLLPSAQFFCRLFDVPFTAGPLPAEAEHSPGRYALSLCAFLGAGVIASRLFERAQAFIVYTLWAAPPSHRIGPIVQSIVSAMISLSVLLALLRGLRRPGSPTVGNFWVDLVRGSLYILLPLALLLTLLLVSRGGVQALAAAIAGRL